MNKIKSIMESNSFNEEIKHGMDPLLEMVLSEEKENYKGISFEDHANKIRHDFEKSSSKHMKRIFHGMALLAEKFGEVE